MHLLVKRISRLKIGPFLIELVVSAIHPFAFFIVDPLRHQIQELVLELNQFKNVVELVSQFGGAAVFFQCRLFNVLGAG